ncbi:MAG: HipA domain-containing protein [Pirellula sp.]
MSALRVRLGDVDIGVLEHFDDESEAFTFADEYLESHINARPILGQLFEDRIPKPIHVGGPFGWFDHLLPQGAMRRWRSRLLSIDEADGFSLLTHLGENLPGAVIMIPTQPLIRRSIERKSAHSLLLKEQPFRFSLAGAQWKLSARSAGRGLTTNASAHGTEYIAKFHSPEYPDLPRCEFATMNWAHKSGIVTPNFELRRVEDFDVVPENMPVGNGDVYVCQRFDRHNTQRIHMEDFAQILDRPSGNEQYRGSYDEIARVLLWIAPDSIEELLRVVIFCLISGNGDAHLKNFSVLYNDGRIASLSPAYDLVATVGYQPYDKLALKFGGSHRFDGIFLERFDAFCNCLGWTKEKLRSFVIEFSRHVLNNWQLPEVNENFPELQREKIRRHVAKIGAEFTRF